MIRSLVVATALVALPVAALAQRQAPAPAPSPAPSPSPPVDICSSGLSAVVSRPTQTTSVCTVKANQVLIETGYQTQTADVAGGSFTVQSVPNATIRIGTALRNVELDVLPPSALRSAGVSATSDVGGGLKWQVLSTPTFAFGVNGIVTAPTGTSPSFTPNGIGSANATTSIVNAQVQGALGKVFGYGAGIGVQNLASAGTHYTSVAPSLDVSASLPASWAVVVEGFQATNGEGPTTPGHTWFDAALEKDIGNAQFDVNYGISNRIAPFAGAAGVQRRYIGAGISYLIP